MIPNTGSDSPLGYSQTGNLSNFALFSSHATKVTLGLFRDNQLIKTYPLHRTKDIWHIGIKDLPDDLTYAYQCEGPKELLYNSEVWLTDPYAKIVIRGKAKAALPAPFDWQNDTPLNTPLSDLILYEMHVRGFTKDPSSGVKYPGTYMGMIEKIPYLKKLGINAVELMPIFGFDEQVAKTPRHLNYWGYNPLHYFAPMDWYGAEDPVSEFKTVVRELHKAGIEVILDVVYNHTGEEDRKNYYVHFRGIDNPVYYLLDHQGEYLNFTGCGNTLNANHPVVEKLILDSLRYWVEEMHVDGFRFDLASTFTRDLQGHPREDAPILKEIEKDPILRKVKWIAEAWDASGLYQLGYFAKRGHWSEWNGKYRDVVRRFIKGSDGKAGLFANVLCGTDLIYPSPLSSINFVTAHDGFTLRDLVSYQQKHNLDNGEHNQDGNNQNDSWNCGHEGSTDDPAIHALRERQMRNFLLALFLSQGIPMLLMGDEYGHTRFGNNNPYVQDNEINWFLWDKQNPKMGEFVSSLISFRKKNPSLRRTIFLKEGEVDWFTDWSQSSRLVAFQLKGIPPLYIAFNANSKSHSLTLPDGNWKLVVDTSEEWIFHKEGKRVSTIELLPYSAILAVHSV